MKLSTSTKWLLYWTLLVVSILVIVLGLFTLPVNTLTGGGVLVLGLTVAFLMVRQLSKKRKSDGSRKKNWLTGVGTAATCVVGIVMISMGGVLGLDEDIRMREVPVDVTPPVTSTPLSTSVPEANPSTPAVNTTVEISDRNEELQPETVVVTLTPETAPPSEIVTTKVVTVTSTVFIPAPQLAPQVPIRPAPRDFEQTTDAIPSTNAEQTAENQVEEQPIPTE